jgi:hypothetical protein
MIHFKSSNPNSSLDQHMVREGKIPQHVKTTF